MIHHMTYLWFHSIGFRQKILQGKQIKILPPNPLLQRLRILLAQVKHSNTSENLLNEIKQIAYSFCREKQVSKKVYNNLL